MHLLLRALAAIAEVLVETDEFDGVPPDADAEPKTAAAENIETRRLLGHENSLSLRQDQHLGREFDLARRGTQESEQHESGRLAALTPST